MNNVIMGAIFGMFLAYLFMISASNSLLNACKQKYQTDCVVSWTVEVNPIESDANK